ncbi:MAG TPA: hypothetical protein VJQ57_15490 [Acidimicrobiia bacterium]|nr:hypothetical protein [Acidimicrobiia bacterium]
MRSSEKVGSRRHQRIEELAELSPGPEMGALLATFSKANLTAADRVLLMQAHQRMVSYIFLDLLAGHPLAEGGKGQGPV